MMRAKLSVAAILSTTAIASGVVLGSLNSAESCMKSKSAEHGERYEQASWLHSPLAAIITLPGIALATSLYLGSRSYHS